MKKILLTLLIILSFAPSTHAVTCSLFQGCTGWSTSTAGDLLVGTSSITQYSRLPIGSNGSLLESSSTAPLGINWIATSTLGFSNYWTLGGSTLSQNSGSTISVGNVVATSTTATSTFASDIYFTGSSPRTISETSPFDLNFIAIPAVTSGASGPNIFVLSGAGAPKGAPGGVSGNGGTLNFTAGQGADNTAIGGSGSGEDFAGTGGNYNFTSGAGGNAGGAADGNVPGAGGLFSFAAGNGGSLVSGSIAGDAAGGGGAFSLAGGVGGGAAVAQQFTGTGGTVTIQSGPSTANSLGGTGGNGGDISIFTNNGGSVSGTNSSANTAGNSGNFTLDTSNGSTARNSSTLNQGSASGNFLIFTGNGGGTTISSTGVNHAGGSGSLTLQTGNGGAARLSSNINTAGSASDIILRAGSGGAALNTNATGGNGGNISLTSGNAGSGATTPGSAGAITLNIGTPSGTGAKGYVNVTGGNFGIATTSANGLLAINPIAGNTNAIVVGSSTQNLYTLDTNGHHIYSGRTPIVSSCGSSPSNYGNDERGRIYVGSGVVTSCTLTFANTYTNPPICIAGDETGTLSVEASSTPSTVVFTTASTIGSGAFVYACDGYQ